MIEAKNSELCEILEENEIVEALNYFFSPRIETLSQSPKEIGLHFEEIIKKYGENKVEIALARPGIYNIGCMYLVVDVVGVFPYYRKMFEKSFIFLLPFADFFNQVLHNIMGLERLAEFFPNFFSAHRDKICQKLLFDPCFFGKMLFLEFNREDDYRDDLEVLIKFFPECSESFKFNYEVIVAIKNKDFQIIENLQRTIEKSASVGAMSCKSLQLCSVFLEAVLNSPDFKIEQSNFSKSVIGLYDCLSEKIAKARVNFGHLGSFGIFPRLQGRERAPNPSCPSGLPSGKPKLSDLTSSSINNV